MDAQQLWLAAPKSLQWPRQFSGTFGASIMNRPSNSSQKCSMLSASKYSTPTNTLIYPLLTVFSEHNEFWLMTQSHDSHGIIGRRYQSLD